MHSAFAYSHTVSQPANQTFDFLSSFIVVKREVIECHGILRRKLAGTAIIDMLDELEGVFVSVNQSEGVIFRIHCQKLEKKKRSVNKRNNMH